MLLSAKIHVENNIKHNYLVYETQCINSILSETDGRLHGNETCTYNFQEEVAEDVAGQGNIPWNERINVEEASEEEVMMLRDIFLKFAKDNFSNATVTILTKDYANEFKEVNSPLPSIDFHI